MAAAGMLLSIASALLSLVLCWSTGAPAVPPEFWPPAPKDFPPEESGGAS